MIKRIAAIVLAVGLVGGAQADPIAGRGTWETTLGARDLNGDGTVDAYFDSVQNITWLADWNYSKTSGESLTGALFWGEALRWADALAIGSYDGWRLPTARNADGSDCYLGECRNSEMLTLWRDTLGNTNGSTMNTGPFVNVTDPVNLSGVQWTSTRFNYGCGGAWYFIPAENRNNASCNIERDRMYATAVLDGDAGTDISAVPTPATIALLGLGLAGISAARRRQASSGTSGELA